MKSAFLTTLLAIMVLQVGCEREFTNTYDEEAKALVLLYTSATYARDSYHQFVNDGAELVSSGEGTVVKHDLSDGSEIWQYNSPVYGDISSVSMDENYNSIAFSLESIINVINAQTGKIKWDIHLDGILNFVGYNNSDSIIVAIYGNKLVYINTNLRQIWDEVYLPGLDATSSAEFFMHPAKTSIAYYDEGAAKIVLYDLNNKSEIWSTKVLTSEAVFSVVFSPDGEYAIIEYFDGENTGFVTLYCNNGAIIWQLEKVNLGHPPSISFHPDGLEVAICSSDIIRIFDTQSGTEIWGNPDNSVVGLTSITYNSDGSILGGYGVLSAGLDTHLYLWDTKTRDMIHDYTPEYITYVDRMIFNSVDRSSLLLIGRDAVRGIDYLQRYELRWLN